MRPDDVPAELLGIADGFTGFKHSPGGSVRKAIAAILTEWDRISAERANGDMRPNGHWCDDACVCFIHDVPLYCNNATGKHACPMTTCPFAHGYESALRETYDRLSSDAATVEQFNVKMARLLGLPTDTPIDETLNLFTQQYCSLRLALGQAASSFGTLPGVLFIEDRAVAIVSAEQVDGWARTARYTRLLGDSPLTATHSVSSVDGERVTSTKGSTMTEPTPETTEVEVEQTEQETAGEQSTDDSTADGE